MSSKVDASDKRRLTPKLRFPGFARPWANEPLAKVLLEHKLKNTGGRDVFSVSMESGIVNQIEHLGRSYAANDTSHYNVGRRYDVVYTKSPLKAFPFGIVKQCKFDGEVALSPLYGVFTPATPHIGLMVEAYFESPNRSRAFLAPLCQKGAKNTLQITNATFLSGRLPLPTEADEQQKIADCLSSVDELIAVQTRKVDALKTHKKGLMQQLFPREGETQPRLRFPEFRDALGWREKPLQAAAAINPANNGLPEEFVYIDLESVDAGLLKTKTRISRIGAPSRAQRLLERGDIIYQVVRPYQRNNLLCNFDDAQVYVASTGYAQLRARGSNRFLYQSIHTDLFVGRVIAKCAGSNYPAINSSDLAEILLPLPPTLPEQEKIADCFAFLDNLIAAQTQNLDALKLHKKGLMQQLFPLMEEA